MTVATALAGKKVIHLFRLPKGGVFRHVADLVRAQSAAGLEIGLICDTGSDDDFADVELEELGKLCRLGVHRYAIARTLSLADREAIGSIRALCESIKPDILHGHGAKGGAYARLIANSVGARSVYTPHGGSLHYALTSPTGLVYLGLEKLLKSRTDGLIFESHYSAGVYEAKLGRFPCERRVIHNGLRDNEFDCWSPEHAEYDFLFIGEYRKLKGISTLLKATARLAETRDLKVLVAGAGPDRTFFERQHQQLKLQQTVELSGPIFPARSAFNRARCVVVPSLAESFPYIVLEALAAGVPVITTNVGGIPEIFDGYSNQLIPPGNTSSLARAMQFALYNPETMQENARLVQAHVRDHFSLAKMNQQVMDYYVSLLSLV